MLVLDTHAWIWLVTNPAKLSASARRRIDAEANLGVAAISTWETAMLVAKGRLTLDRATLTWIRDALGEPRIMLLPITPEIAVTATELKLHGDPSDRLIVATALEHGADLVTADATIRRSRVVKSVW